MGKGCRFDDIAPTSHGSSAGTLGSVTRRNRLSLVGLGSYLSASEADGPRRLERTVATASPVRRVQGPEDGGLRRGPTLTTVARSRVDPTKAVPMVVRKRAARTREALIKAVAIVGTTTTEMATTRASRIKRGPRRPVLSSAYGTKAARNRPSPKGSIAFGTVGPSRTTSLAADRGAAP